MAPWSPYKTYHLFCDISGQPDRIPRRVPATDQATHQFVDRRCLQCLLVPTHIYPGSGRDSTQVERRNDWCQTHQVSKLFVGQNLDFAHNDNGFNIIK